MKEIGGYIELDSYRLPMLHEGAAALNCGRNALAYLIRTRKISKLWVPRFICDSVTEVCKREGAALVLYDIGQDFLPAQELKPEKGEWLYLVNYYSQLTNEQIAAYAEQYPRVIVDNAQSYFQQPLPGIDTLYTCRKYFGVADGAFLYTDAKLEQELEQDESFDRMRFLLGRFERSASEFYAGYSANNRLFADEPIKRMSRLTDNLLHGIDYAAVEQRRRENFEFLHERLGDRNQLKIRNTGTFMYPFMIENGTVLRKKLQVEKIYIPTLWPSVFEITAPEDTAYKMAEAILPLPIDQRYGLEEMNRVVEEIERCMNI